MNTPGTLALAVVRGVPSLALAVTDGRRVGWATPFPIASFTNHPEDEVTDVVPLVVAQVTDAHLAALDAVRNGTATSEDCDTLGALADLLTAARQAVRPPEPTARGSVVIDEDDLEWVRAAGPDEPSSWMQFETDQSGVAYDQIPAVRVP